MSRQTPVRPSSAPLFAAAQANTEPVTPKAKVDAIRALMAKHKVDAYLVPSADEHINEYLPKEHARREWLSGFTGSAGDCLVGKTAAWVYADSRYYEQADTEVDSQVFTVSKVGLDGEPTLGDTLKTLAQKAQTTGKGFKLGYDPFTLTVGQAQQYQKLLTPLGGKLLPITGNWIDTLWTQTRPQPVKSRVFSIPEKATGGSVEEKLTQVRKQMKALQAQVLPLTKLDQIAWMFNLRGADIPYNPVFLSYGIITPKKAYLFTETGRIDPAAARMLSKHGVVTLPYTDYAKTLKQVSRGKTVLIDSAHTTEGTLQLVSSVKAISRQGQNPVQLSKALKNLTELDGMRAANLRASVAKTKALFWLDQQLSQGKTVTEETFRQAIEGFYAQDPAFVGLSFNTIAGAGANSSIVHYGTPNPQKALSPGEFFLIDSGAQYFEKAAAKPWCGTTDDTRTVIVGNPTAEQKEKYTAVLKAHIACARQIFPKGTDGIKLDGITRAALWQQGLDFGHGTGHGVGAFLNVHEGPNGIHGRASEPLVPGMVTSIEPGFYKPGWGGIRLENLYIVRDLARLSEPDQKALLGFESLTYVPFDSRLIETAQLSPDEKAWLKDYHRSVQQKLAPFLSKAEQEWLKQYCG